MLSFRNRHKQSSSPRIQKGLRQILFVFQTVVSKRNSSQMVVYRVHCAFHDHFPPARLQRFALSLVLLVVCSVISFQPLFFVCLPKTMHWSPFGLSCGYWPGFFFNFFFFPPSPTCFREILPCLQRVGNWCVCVCVIFPVPPTSQESW